MITAFIVLVALSVGACLGLLVGGLCAIQKDPAASRTLPIPDAGGSWAGFNLPGSLALASPLAGHPPPSGLDSPKLVRPGRGMNLNAVLNAFHSNDFSCAESVAITIDGDKVWLEVDGMNVFRAYNVEIIQIDDRRERHAEISQEAS